MAFPLCVFLTIYTVICYTEGRPHRDTEESVTRLINNLARNSKSMQYNKPLLYTNLSPESASALYSMEKAKTRIKRTNNEPVEENFVHNTELQANFQMVFGPELIDSAKGVNDDVHVEETLLKDPALRDNINDVFGLSTQNQPQLESDEDKSVVDRLTNNEFQTSTDAGNSENDPRTTAMTKLNDIIFRNFGPEIRDDDDYVIDHRFIESDTFNNNHSNFTPMNDNNKDIRSSSASQAEVTSLHPGHSSDNKDPENSPDNTPTAETRIETDQNDTQPSSGSQPIATGLLIVLFSLYFIFC